MPGANGFAWDLRPARLNRALLERNDGAKHIGPWRSPICRAPSSRSRPDVLTRRIPFRLPGGPMRTRFLLMLVTLLLPAFAATSSGGWCLQPDKLVLLSTTDVKGKTGPCGCHVPKGGLARRAGFADSIRAQFGQVALVDAGGCFA